MAEIKIWELIENTKNYKLSAVYVVLTVTTRLFADTDSSTLALNLDQREKTEIPKVIKARSFKPILAVQPAFHIWCLIGKF